MVEVVEGVGREQSASATESPCLSQRKSSEVKPVDANKIIRTIDRSANNQPAKDEVERLRAFFGMINSTEVRWRFRGSVLQSEMLLLLPLGQSFGSSRRSQTSSGQFVTWLQGVVREFL